MDETESTTTRAPDIRYVWVDPEDRALGGQWVRSDGDTEVPISLLDALAAHRGDERALDPVTEHVAAAWQVLDAAGVEEDRLLPDPATRVQRALDTSRALIDAESPAGERVRRCAEALHKLAADLAEVVEEQLEGGSLATLPPATSHALCQTTQAAWRLRSHVEPPGPLYL